MLRVSEVVQDRNIRIANFEHDIWSMITRSSLSESEIIAAISNTINSLAYIQIKEIEKGNELRKHSTVN